MGSQQSVSDPPFDSNVVAPPPPPQKTLKGKPGTAKKHPNRGKQNRLQGWLAGLTGPGSNSTNQDNTHSVTEPGNGEMLEFNGQFLSDGDRTLLWNAVEMYNSVMSPESLRAQVGSGANPTSPPPNFLFSDIVSEGGDDDESSSTSSHLSERSCSAVSTHGESSPRHIQSSELSSSSSSPKNAFATIIPRKDSSHKKLQTAGQPLIRMASWPVQTPSRPYDKPRNPRHSDPLRDLRALVSPANSPTASTPREPNGREGKTPKRACTFTEVPRSHSLRCSPGPSPRGKTENPLKVSSFREVRRQESQSPPII